MKRQILTDSDIANCIELSMQGIRIKDIHDAIERIIDSLKPVFDLVQENIEYMVELKTERIEEKMEEKKYSKNEVLELFDKAVEQMEELVEEATKDAKEGIGKLALKLQNQIVAGMIKNNLIEMVGVDDE